MRQYIADFETTTKEDDCRVWAFGIMELGNHENITIGTTIDEFMEWCQKQDDNPKVYFHNLKFDSSFLMYWLFLNDFKHVSSEERASQTFTTVISNKGLFYAIEVIFYLRGKKVKKVTFWDSLKLIPLSVEDIAETFSLPYKKLKIDYDAHNNQPVGAPITESEKEYLIHDLKIVAHALEYFQSEGLTRMTIGSCALHEYKEIIGKKEFKRRFPTPKYHDDISPCYKGGYVYVNPEISGRQLGRGIVLDKNSMFPWVMKEKELPWGTPVFFKGQYKPDAMYPLSIQMIRCGFELREGMLPTLQIKKSLWFSGTEYLRSSNYRELTLCMTSVDLELFLKHYKTYNLEYLSGWKFRSTKGADMFGEYIDKWNAKKVKARENNNPGLAFTSKLYLNNLYGKFGTSNKLQEKLPYISEKDGAIHYKDAPSSYKDGIYLPVAAFITAWARFEMVSAAQTIIDNYNSGKSKIKFCYCDTDSLHCLSEDYSLPEGLHIDKHELGAWKFESKFKRAKFLRTKCYIEESTEDVYNDDPEWDLKITVAGMPDDCKENVTFHNFKLGATYSGKKQPKTVKGGVVLQNIDFTIKKV